MSDSPKPPASADLGILARVSVAASCREQVALVRGATRGATHVHAVRGDVLELVGPTFYPKNCALDLELTGGALETPLSLRGTVRRVQMPGIEPTYALAVHLDGEDARPLAALGAARDTVRDPRPFGARAAPGARALPSWATLLLEHSAVDEAALRALEASAKAERVPLAEAVVSAGIASAETLAACMAVDFGVPYVEPREYEIQLANLELLPGDFARRNGLFPLFETGGVITLGMADPTDLALVDQVRLRTSRQVEPCLCPPGTLESLLDRALRRDGPVADVAPMPPRAVDPAPESEVVRLVTSVVADAARGGASDVHIEPERDHVRVRVRIDGILHETGVHALALHAGIVSRIKVQAKLDIAETRRAQDGHFSVSVDRQTVDVRVSTMPTVYGENVVLRLVLSDAEAIRLEQLGMPAEIRGRFERLLEHPHGMILVTGPTGSGKTSTLYAALARLNTVHRNVVTIEDPVERRIPLLRQTQVNPRAGVTFASGLRSILRQDPDVIMVGEIRDEETAEISVQAALTGHLVLSTLHTNTAAGAVVRLNEMGVPPFLVTSSLRAVVAQRLVRRICDACASELAPDPRLLVGLGLDEADPGPFRAGRGCARCLDTGYRGRLGLYEMLEMDAGLSEALLGGASRERVEREAHRALGGSLRDDGIRKARGGATTLEEIARVAGLANGLANGAQGS